MRRVIRSGWLTTGPEAAAFETEFAAYVGCRHALAVNSATAGLHLCLEALGIGNGDVVVTTPYTFTATAEVIRYLGADPGFVDIDEVTGNIDPEQVARAIAGRRDQVKAILPVHLGGLPCDMASLGSVSKGIPIVEDAAHSFPVRLDGRFVGTIGTAGVFSFYANKTMTTGEGGMVTTDDDKLAARVTLMRFHGVDRQAWSRYTSRNASWRYAVVEAGYKYNMTDIAAALGRVQLTRAESLRQDRLRIAHAYREGLSDVDFLSLPAASAAHAWHLYAVRLELDLLSVTRDEFIERMSEAGIGTSVHYIPLHLMPYYAQRYSLSPDDFPVALKTYQRTISLPIYPGLRPRELDRIIQTIRRIGAATRR